MTDLPQSRLAWRRVLSLFMMAAVLMPAMLPLPADAQSQGDLDELDTQIDQAEEERERLDSEVGVSVEELNRIVAEQQELQAELDVLNDELAGAEAVLLDRERILAATTAELNSTATRLDQTRAQLDSQRAAFEARVRQSYISARPDQTLPAFSMRSASDFAQATTYLEAIVSRDRAGFEQIDVLRRRIEADEIELIRLQGQQDSDRAAAQVETDRVAELVLAQQDLVAQVQARADEKRTVLAGLEANRDTAQALIDELEAESALIEQELAAVAAAAAAAAAAEAAAAAGTAGSSPSGTAGVVAGSGRFILPISGRISSEYGYRIHPISGVRKLHAGMDISAGSGTPIGAAGPGTVIFAGWRGGYGNAVIIDHGGGIATLYAHQSRLAASTGQSVSTGQIIGYVGSTGYSTGPHLHWEVRVNGTPVNPRGYL